MSLTATMILAEADGMSKKDLGKLFVKEIKEYRKSRKEFDKRMAAKHKYMMGGRVDET